jgi:glycosyltransferase involved in cell wall biosynthesis
MPTLSGGGAEYQWRVLAKELKRLGHDVHVATLTDARDSHERELRDAAIARHVLAPGFQAAQGQRLKRAAALVRATARLRQLILLTNPDVVYSCLTVTNLVARTATATTRAKLVWGIRGLREPFPYFPRLLSGLEQRASEHLPLVIVNSEATRRYHEQRGLRPARWAVVNNGFDVDRFRPNPAANALLRKRLALDLSTVVIGCVARFTPEKDHGTLLRAMRWVHQSNPHTRLLLVGAGTRHVNDRINAYIRAFSLSDVVYLLGAEERVEDYFATFDIHALASWSESFPNAVGEAMAAGCAVVATDVGGMRELVGEAGVLVSPRDEHALARALLELAGDASLRKTLGVLARKRVVERFTIPAMALRTRDAWRSSQDLEGNS